MFFKIEIYVPATHAEPLRAAIAAADICGAAMDVPEVENP